MLYEQLPRHIYNDEAHVQALQAAIESELCNLQEARDDLFLQFRPSTATWGLAHYEKEYSDEPSGIKDPKEQLEYWKAKRRGRGTTTAAVIANMAQSFSAIPVEVLDDPSKYQFTICVDVLAMAQQKEMTAAIDSVKPAHLAMLIEFVAGSTEKTQVFVCGVSCGAVCAQTWPQGWVAKA